MELTDKETESITTQVTAYLKSESPESQITPEDIINFLQQIWATPNKLALAKTFTEDLQTFRKLLQEIKPLVRASIKKTITKFINSPNKSAQDLSDNESSHSHKL